MLSKREGSRVTRSPNKIQFIAIGAVAFFMKDIVATIAVLSTEPGVTQTAALYYKIAQLPGRLFLDAGPAMFVNVAFGGCTGWVVYRWALWRCNQRNQE
jgi:hypothetical protein